MQVDQTNAACKLHITYELLYNLKYEYKHGCK